MSWPTGTVGKAVCTNYASYVPNNMLEMSSRTQPALLIAMVEDRPVCPPLPLPLRADGPLYDEDGQEHGRPRGQVAEPGRHRPVQVGVLVHHLMVGGWKHLDLNW